MQSEGSDAEQGAHHHTRDHIPMWVMTDNMTIFAHPRRRVNFKPRHTSIADIAELPNLLGVTLKASPLGALSRQDVTSARHSKFNDAMIKNVKPPASIWNSFFVRFKIERKHKYKQSSNDFQVQQHMPKSKAQDNKSELTNVPCDLSPSVCHLEKTPSVGQRDCELECPLRDMFTVLLLAEAFGAPVVLAVDWIPFRHLKLGSSSFR
jgi:hypothetical protein